MPCLPSRQRREARKALTQHKYANSLTSTTLCGCPCHAPFIEISFFGWKDKSSFEDLLEQQYKVKVQKDCEGHAKWWNWCQTTLLDFILSSLWLPFYLFPPVYINIFLLFSPFSFILLFIYAFLLADAKRTRSYFLGYTAINI